MTTLLMSQRAPYPAQLRDLVARLRYKPGWVFRLEYVDRGQGSAGMTFTVTTETPDSYNPQRTVQVNHLFPVPPAAYDVRSWQHWLLEQLLLVERHECCEFFRFLDDGVVTRSDGQKVGQREVRPYAPSHGPGNDPYIVRELGTELDVRTSFRGELNPA